MLVPGSSTCSAAAAGSDMPSNRTAAAHESQVIVTATCDAGRGASRWWVVSTWSAAAAHARAARRLDGTADAASPPWRSWPPALDRAPIAEPDRARRRDDAELGVHVRTRSRRPHQQHRPPSATTDHRATIHRRRPVTTADEPCAADARAWRSPATCCRTARCGDRRAHAEAGGEWLRLHPDARRARALVWARPTSRSVTSRPRSRRAVRSTQTMPFYGVPAEIADAIAAAGYDRCSTASNHAADRGTAGIDRTVDVLEAAGLGQSGMARTPAEIEPRVFDVAGVTMSHLSYTCSYNGLSSPGRRAVAFGRSSTRSGSSATPARARELGAELVIVSLHWGTESVHGPTAYQRRSPTRSRLDRRDRPRHRPPRPRRPADRAGERDVGGVTDSATSCRTCRPATDGRQRPRTRSWWTSTSPSTTTAQSPSGDRVCHPTWVDKDAGWVVRIVDDELARTDIGAGQRARLERSRERTAAVLGDFMATGG